MNFVFEKIESDDEFLNFVNCPDINHSGIRRFTPCPIAFTSIRFKTSESDIYRAFSKNIKCLDTPIPGEKYIIASGVAHAPIDWCGPDSNMNGFDSSQPNKKSAFAYLNDQYLADMQAGRAFLLLDQSHEGYQTTWLWEWFHNNCNQYGINPKQIIYVTGNMECDKQYKEWADNRGITDRLLTVPYPHFEIMIRESAVDQNRNEYTFFKNKNKLPTLAQQLAYKTTSKEIIKTFDALQKRPRAHRIWFFKYLRDANLLNDGILSMPMFDQTNAYFEGRSISNFESSELINLTPIDPIEHPTNHNFKNFVSEVGGKYLTQINHKTMLNSWVSVISEASFGDTDSTCFISEKTFKPITCFQPFIILGNKRSLENLRKIGYKTFYPFINEEYDTLPTWERMDAIIKELTRIKQMTADEKLAWYKSMSHILSHNYKILQRNSSDLIPPAMTTINKYFNNV